MITATRGRYRGCLLGLAVGDAVGTTAEFRPRGTFPTVTGMNGGGPFGLAPGQWTDDTSMALCLAESLLARDGFDARDQMTRYVDWWRSGYLSSTGECFDIGDTIRDALMRFQATGEPFSGPDDPQTAGNGSLMRLAPIALFYSPALDDVDRFSAGSSRTTHAAPEAVECCQLFGLYLARALAGMPQDDVLAPSGLPLREPKVLAISRGDYFAKSCADIAGAGYCVASLEAALWCFRQADTFEAAVLEAANLGDDADTTAAITGQLAGAYYGVEAIPAAWLDTLCMRDRIADLANRLYDRAGGRQGRT